MNAGRLGASLTPEQYLLPADLFVRSASRVRSRAPIRYWRFATLALALKFAVEEEEFPLASVVIRTDDAELTGGGIQVAYDAFPTVPEPMNNRSMNK